MGNSDIEKILHRSGFNDFKWISGKDIQVRQWVRFKCMFGCDSYGKKGTCPPEVPSVSECRELFSEYEHALIIHLTAQFENPDDRKPWSRKKNMELLKAEQEVFLSGFHKAFLLFMDECRICAECTGSRKGCIHQNIARPGPESLAVDVFATVRATGYPIEVLNDYRQTMNRYAFLLID